MNTIKGLEEIVRRAQAGDWSYVDANVKGFIDEECVAWALGVGLHDPSDNIRDLAATILDEAPIGSLKPDAFERLELQMDMEPYDIVHFRLAIALWKNGHRPSAVELVVEEAKAHPEVGKVAVTYCS